MASCKECLWFYQETFDDGYSLPPECLSPDAPSWNKVFCSPDNPSCCDFAQDFFAFNKEVSE